MVDALQIMFSEALFMDHLKTVKTKRSWLIKMKIDKK